MKRKMIPVILMLLAGAIASIITYVQDYELTTMLWILLGTFIVFYLLGIGIRNVLNAFDKQIEEAKRKEDEGAVIEKELNEEDMQNTNESGEAQEPASSDKM